MCLTLPDLPQGCLQTTLNQRPAVMQAIYHLPHGRTRLRDLFFINEPTGDGHAQLPDEGLSSLRCSQSQDSSSTNQNAEHNHI